MDYSVLEIGSERKVPPAEILLVAKILIKGHGSLKIYDATEFSLLYVKWSPDVINDLPL